MSRIDDKEKAAQTEAAFEIDKYYLQALDCLREELIQQGIDIDSGEGRKTFIRAVRRLNDKFYT